MSERMKCVIRLHVVWCAVFAFWIDDAQAQALLAPPFGLQWGDTPDKVLDWAEEQALDVNIKIPGKRPEIREIRVSAEGGTLPNHQASVLEVRYHWGQLFEVTLHYGASGGSAAKIKADFDKLKSALTLKHGVFQVNNKSDVVTDGYIQKSLSYHVEPVSGLMLLMAFTEVEDTVREVKSTRFSLLYQNYNILPK